MGQVCSGEQSESRKAGAFQEIDTYADGTVKEDDFARHQLEAQQNRMMLEEQRLQEQTADSTIPTTKEDEERLKALREEQARLDMIVNAAGRGMVAVRSTRGSTGYYDQGFAAALAQHLEQTTQFPDHLAVRLPPPSTQSSVYERLSQPQWDGIVLGNAGGPAGCGGENPMQLVDTIAESLLDEAVPTKQKLLAGTRPLVENLL